MPTAAPILVIAILAVAGTSGCASKPSTYQGGYDPGLDVPRTVSAREYGYVRPARDVRVIGDDTRLSYGGRNSEDLWDRVRHGPSLGISQNDRIDRAVSALKRNPTYLTDLARRARPYLHVIVGELERAGMPTELALLPEVESRYNPRAISPKSASGMWQFMPYTGTEMGLVQNGWYDGRNDILASTRGAIAYLTQLRDEFDGDWALALASYTAGPGRVRSAQRANKARGKPTDFWSLDLPQETRAYVPKLLALKKLIAQPTDYDLALPTIPDQPYFARVELGSQIDLARAAKLAQITMDELYRLNPGYNRWATAPDGPHHLLIPLDRIETFSAGLAALPADQRISWIRYRIRSGDTLSTIAAKHRISITTLKKVNHIRGTQLRAGRSLMIPVASQSASSYRLSATQRKQTQQNQPRKGTRVVHIVRKGDTFWDLSRKHNVSTRALAKWNGMAPRDPLVPGQKLVIWSRTTTTSSHLEPAVLTLPTQRSITKRIGYKVRRGDSLDKISRKFRVSISQLRRWNNLPKGKYLQPGQRLTLYVDVTRQSS